VSPLSAAAEVVSAASTGFARNPIDNRIGIDRLEINETDEPTGLVDGMFPPRLGNGRAEVI